MATKKKQPVVDDEAELERAGMELMLAFPPELPDYSEKDHETEVRRIFAMRPRHTAAEAAIRAVQRMRTLAPLMAKR